MGAATNERVDQQVRRVLRCDDAGGKKGSAEFPHSTPQGGKDRRTGAILRGVSDWTGCSGRAWRDDGMTLGGLALGGGAGLDTVGASCNRSIRKLEKLEKNRRSTPAGLEGIGPVEP